MAKIIGIYLEELKQIMEKSFLIFTVKHIRYSRSTVQCVIKK